MSKFTDQMGDTWAVEFDGLLLDEIANATGVDLADLSGGGLVEVEQDAKKLVRVLCVICADEISNRGKSNRDFAKRIVGETIEKATEAIVSAAGNFFPPKQWSELQSRLDSQRQLAEQTRTAKPLMALLAVLPEGMRIGAMEELQRSMAQGMSEGTTAPTNTTTSAQSEPSPSVIGQDATQPTVAPNVLENAGLVHAG